MKDEFVKNTGSLRNLADMLNHVRSSPNSLTEAHPFV